MKMKNTFVLAALAMMAVGCNSNTSKKDTATESTAEETQQYKADTVQTAIGKLILPAPYATESETKRNGLSEWPDGATPSAPEGFNVSLFAEDFDNPRWTYIAPNGDYFVVESNTVHSANKVTILRDSNNDGTFEVRETFLENLNQPFGMLVVGDFFYVANTDGLYKYPYKTGQTKMTAKGTKILELPAGGYNNHWTRNIITNKAKDKIYISVGSGSNVAEHGIEEEERRANILVVDLDGENEEIYASGLRNPVGMDWNPANGELWTAVNERDNLGDNLVPDYITSVKEGAFYGWPYSYYGDIVDPRWEGKTNDSLVKASLIPDVSVGPHTASLGFTFYASDQFPEKYKDGAFVGQHGSWNRSEFSGYKVVFVPFKNGKPAGQPEDFLTGFIADASKAKAYGRPVGVTVTPNGALLVNDDAGNKIWKVSHTN